MSVESPLRQKQTIETQSETPTNIEQLKTDNLSKILEELLQRPELVDEIVHDTLFKFKRFSDFLFSQFEAGKIDSYILKIKSDSFFDEKIKPLPELTVADKLKIQVALFKDRNAKTKNQISQNS